jgi:hypothetical protein
LTSDRAAAAVCRDRSSPRRAHVCARFRRGEEFDRPFRQSSLPLLKSFHIETVAFGPSNNDPERYPLIRSFPSESERVTQLDTFYGSPAWDECKGAILPLIESLHQVVITCPIPRKEIFR